VQGPPGPSGTSHGYLASTNGVSVAQYPVFSPVVALHSVPDGTYELWAAIPFLDLPNEPAVICEADVNGVVVPFSSAGDILKVGVGEITFDAVQVGMHQRIRAVFLVFLHDSMGALPVAFAQMPERLQNRNQSGRR